jgi:hypothetical protein
VVLDLAAGRRATDEAVCAMLRAEPRLVDGVEVRLHLIMPDLRLIHT